MLDFIFERNEQDEISNIYNYPRGMGATQIPLYSNYQQGKILWIFGAFLGDYIYLRLCPFDWSEK